MGLCENIAVTSLPHCNGGAIEKHKRGLSSYQDWSACLTGKPPHCGLVRHWLEVWAGEYWAYGLIIP